MSKAKLKKELQLMSHEQLMEIILNLYSARKEAKDYFEFFLNPDCGKLLQKYETAVQKETFRAKRRYAKFRITQIRRLIKDFQSFDPGAEYVLELYIFTFTKLMSYSRIFNYSDTQENAVCDLALEILEYGDRNSLFSNAYQSIRDIFNNESGSEKYLRQRVGRVIEVMVKEPEL